MKHAKTIVLAVSALAFLAVATAALADDGGALSPVVHTATFDESFGITYEIEFLVSLESGPVGKTVRVSHGDVLKFRLSPSNGYEFGAGCVLKVDGAGQSFTPTAEGREYAFAVNKDIGITVEGISAVETARVSLDAGSAAGCVLVTEYGTGDNRKGRPFDFGLELKETHYDDGSDPGHKVRCKQGETTVEITPVLGVYSIGATNSDCTISVPWVKAKTVIAPPEGDSRYVLEMNKTRFEPGETVEITITPGAEYARAPVVKIGTAEVSLSPCEKGYRGSAPAPAKDAGLTVALRETLMDVTFRFNGATILDKDGKELVESDLQEKGVRPGFVVKIPESVPKKDGAVFKGWTVVNDRIYKASPGDSFPIKAHWEYDGASKIVTEVVVKANFAEIHKVSFDPKGAPLYMQPISHPDCKVGKGDEFRFKLAVRPGYAAAIGIYDEGDDYIRYGGDVYGWVMGPGDRVVTVDPMETRFMRLTDCVDFYDLMDNDTNLIEVDMLAKAGKPFLIAVSEANATHKLDFKVLKTLPAGTKMVFYDAGNAPTYALTFPGPDKFDKDYADVNMKYGYSVIDLETADETLKKALRDLGGLASQAVEFEMNGKMPFKVGVGVNVCGLMGPGSVVDVYVYDGANGKFDAVVESVVVDADGMANFETDHFSVYAVVKRASQPEADPDGPAGGNTMLFAAVAVAAVAAAAAAMYFRGRKR